MRQILLFMSFFMSAIVSFGQFAYFNSDEFWQKTPLLSPNTDVKILPSDTAIIVASNREEDISKIRYLPEMRSGKGIRYFVVFSRNGKWNVLPVSSLQDALHQMPRLDLPWVIYTEGMGKFFTSNLDRGMNLSAQYGVNVLMFDYPSLSSHRKRLGNYFFAKKNATVAYHDFLPVLKEIRLLNSTKQFGQGGINLFFHSMGNIVMQQIVKHHLVNELNGSKWVNNLIFNAPCIPQKGHQKMIDQIHFAKHIYINYNPEDYTLGGAYLVSKRYQLGKQIHRPLAKEAIYVNFNDIAGDGHSNFLNLIGRNEIPPAAENFYYTLFHGDTASVHNTVLFLPSKHRKIGYDLLPIPSTTAHQ
ncbi:MAG: alpha/beta hydrolase [Bacteroidetes bacterium]|nr:alpha/beta hydrolase [Bacteroidota bacterium]